MYLCTARFTSVPSTYFAAKSHMLGSRLADGVVSGRDGASGYITSGDAERTRDGSRSDCDTDIAMRISSRSIRIE